MSRGIHDPSERAAGFRLSAERESRSPANRSLERGVALLRAFRPGSELLGNADLAERTGLSRSTVSRLTQTLVSAGMLRYEAAGRAYALSPAVLSLAHAMRAGSSELLAAAPLMRKCAEENRINVGLAAPDLHEMVYLESIRFTHRPVVRTVSSGQRVPMELTSLGRAYLAVAPDERREALLSHFEQKRGLQWKTLGREIQNAIDQVRTGGYCSAAWQAEVVALATPLRQSSMPLILNVSVSTSDAVQDVITALAPVLLDLAHRVDESLAVHVRAGRAAPVLPR